MTSSWRRWPSGEMPGGPFDPSHTFPVGSAEGPIADLPDDLINPDEALRRLFDFVAPESTTTSAHLPAESHSPAARSPADSTPWPATAPAGSTALGPTDDGEETLAAVREAMNQQLTQELIEKVTNATDGAWLKARDPEGRLLGDLDAHDIVQTVVERTWEGTLRWRCLRVSLLQHLRDSVQQIVRRTLAKGCQRVDLDEQDDATHDAVEQEIGAVWSHEGSDPVRDRDVARLTHDVTQVLWDLATVSADDDVITGLALFLQGHHGEVDMVDAGMDPAAARRAWRRLRQWFDDLPDALRERARDLTRTR